MTTSLTDDERIELEARRRADELLTDAVAGVSLGYVMMQIKELRERVDAQGARLGTVEAKAARHDDEIPRLNTALSKAREAFRASKVGSDHQPKPAPSKGATR